MVDRAIVGIDAGQTGTLARARFRDRVVDARAGRVASPTDAESLAIMTKVVGCLLDELGSPRAVSTVIGTTGVAQDPRLNAHLAEFVADRTGSRRVVLAADCVISHVGALSGRPGTVLAAGTGTTVCARTEKRWLPRLDGHGPLLGDRGSSFSIGLAGLRSALRHRDVGAPGAGLLAAAEAEFGPVPHWPSVLQLPAAAPRIAAFAGQVLRAAATGDHAARVIRAVAATALAETVAAAAKAQTTKSTVDEESYQVEISWTGDLLDDVGLRGRFVQMLTRRCPMARISPPEGTALDGAMRLACEGKVRPEPGLVDVHRF